MRGLVRALRENVRHGRISQGGSTITQQVAKAFLSPERSFTRKLREAILARRLEARFSKREILALYLNHIFLATAASGVQAASRRFFDKTCGSWACPSSRSSLDSPRPRRATRRLTTRCRRRRDAIGSAAQHGRVRHGAGGAGRDDVRPADCAQATTRYLARYLAVLRRLRAARADQAVRSASGLRGRLSHRDHGAAASRRAGGGQRQPRDATARQAPGLSRSRGPA